MVSVPMDDVAGQGESESVAIGDFRPLEVPDLIDNCSRRYSQPKTSTPPVSRAVEATEQRPTAELRIVREKQHLLKLVKPVTESLSVPDELLRSSAPTPTDMELLEIVRLPVPLRLKESTPIRRADKAHVQPNRSCAFRARTIPLPPRVLFGELEQESFFGSEHILAPALAEDDACATVTVRFPVAKRHVAHDVQMPARKAAVAVTALRGEKAVEQIAAAWPNLSGKARRVIMELVEKNR